MNIVVHTKSNCPNCVSAKQLLKYKKLEFREVCLDDEADRVTFAVNFPEARQMPQIFIDGQRVGGFAGLREALKQAGV